MTTPSGRATGRHSSDRQSSSTADPSTPHDEANWSISPHWTPTYTFSARWQMRARVIASTDVARLVEQRPGRGELDRGRGRQPGRGRERRGDDAVQAAQRQTGLAERPGRARDVVQPRPGARPVGLEVEPVTPAVVEPGQLDPAVVGRQIGDADLEVDGRRQHEPEVVVGVLADEVDPAGGADDPDLAAATGGLRHRGDQRVDELVRLERCRSWLPRSRRPVRRVVPTFPAGAEEAEQVLASVGMRAEPLPVEIDPEARRGRHVDVAVATGRIGRSTISRDQSAVELVERSPGRRSSGCSRRAGRTRAEQTGPPALCGATTPGGHRPSPRSGGSATARRDGVARAGGCGSRRGPAGRRTGRAR